VQVDQDERPANFELGRVKSTGVTRPRPACQTGFNNTTKREETMKPFWRLLALSAASGTLLAPAGNARAQLPITGNAEKVSFDETGKIVIRPPGKETVSIIDIHDPTKPRILANLPLMNSINGPIVRPERLPPQPSPRDPRVKLGEGEEAASR
jgi:hypothetical protein